MRSRIKKPRKTKQKPRIRSVFPPAPSPRQELAAATAVPQGVTVPALPGVPRRAKWPSGEPAEPEATAQPYRRTPPAAPRPVCPPARPTRPHPRL